jgi:large subunit ribosomal protein L25
MDAQTVQAETRTDFGKGAARKLRAAGRIPAVVYRAGGESSHFSVDPTPLQLMYRRIGNPNLLINLEADGKSLFCILKDAQKHPLSRDLLHIDFYEVKAKEEVAVEVLVRISGKAEGETFGARITFLRRTLRVAAKPADIPAEITLDVSAMNVGDFFRAKDVILPAGVSLAIHPGTNILTCAGKRAAPILDEVVADVDADADADGAEEAAE